MGRPNPCPFCRGTEMHLVRYEQNGSLCCSGCGAQGPITVIGDASQADATGLATAAWNTRSDDQQSQATERLREALKAARVAVESWGAYADPYFQEKWDLKGDLSAIDAALSVTEPSAEGGVS